LRGRGISPKSGDRHAGSRKPAGLAARARRRGYLADRRARFATQVRQRETRTRTAAC